MRAYGDNTCTLWMNMSGCVLTLQTLYGVHVRLALTNGQECTSQVSRHFSFNGVYDVTFSQLGGRKRIGEEKDGGGSTFAKVTELSLTATRYEWNIVG